MKADATVRKELIALLEGGNAHMSFEEVIVDLKMLKEMLLDPKTDLYAPFPMLRDTTFSVKSYLRRSRCVPHRIMGIMRQIMGIRPDHGSVSDRQTGLM